MLKINTETIFTARNIQNGYGFLIKAGFSVKTANNILRKEAKSIKLSHLEALCTKLNCTPNDLIEFEPTQNTPLTPSHPLLALQKNLQDAKNISNALKSLPLDKLKEISNFISSIENKQQ